MTRSSSGGNGLSANGVYLINYKLIALLISIKKKRILMRGMNACAGGGA
jgi:hypothetical protein